MDPRVVYAGQLDVKRPETQLATRGIGNAKVLHWFTFDHQLHNVDGSRVLLHSLRHLLGNVATSNHTIFGKVYRNQGHNCTIRSRNRRASILRPVLFRSACCNKDPILETQPTGLMVTARKRRQPRQMLDVVVRQDLIFRHNQNRLAAGDTMNRSRGKRNILADVHFTQLGEPLHVLVAVQDKEHSLTTIPVVPLLSSTNKSKNSTRL
mmetsp:Transcript_54585/g.145808  ORF Transcript_54585/g.145808 Transcript_54585/m.145808 type:complete len:208 (+) Transcript_54585:3828-4451(+)